MESNTITMKDLTTRLNAALNMLKGFCYNGRLCNGWSKVNGDETVIQFRYSDNGQIVRIRLDEIDSIGTEKIYDKRNDFNKPYPNVITKTTMTNLKAIFVGNGGTAPGERENGHCIWHDTKVYVYPLIDGISDNLWKRIYNETNDYRPMLGKDGSKVYCDMDNYEIVRKLNGKRIVIANITEVG